MAVFDIRGTHGSGKSHIIHTLLKQYGNEPITEGSVDIGHRISGLGCVVVGRYTTACGGCDGIKTQDEVVRRVRLLNAEYAVVLLEGILVGHTYSRYAALASEIGHYTFLFLTTPLETCIARVKARRLQKGNTKPLDPKNIIKDHECIHQKLPGKFKDNGYNVINLPTENPAVKVIELIKQARKRRI